MIATLEELMNALGAPAKRTVLRKLKALGYRTSYSHRGGYYTLEDTPVFDSQGLWSFHAVWFSAHGTLLSTAEAWIQTAAAGYFVDELDNLLHVGTKDALRQLAREGRVAREPSGRGYLYCSMDGKRKRRQLLLRQAQQTAGGWQAPLPATEVLSDELKAAIVLFFSLLDEQQRRLYAGLESLKMGHGGDTQIAQLLGLDVGTVARGRTALVQRDVQIDRVRRTGGGRKAVEKKRRRSSPASKN
jgi:hypothetical protein